MAAKAIKETVSDKLAWVTAMVAIVTIMGLGAVSLLGVPAYAASADVAQVKAADGTVTAYPSLKDAVKAAPDGATITMLADETLPAYSGSGTTLSLEITKPLTIDGAGHTVTVEGRGIYITGSDDPASPNAVTIRNITLTNASPAGRVVSARNGYKTLDFEDVVMITTGSGNTQVFTAGGNTPQMTDINFKGCTLTASRAGYGIITFNPVDMTLADTDVSGYGAIYLKGPDSSAGSDGSIVNIVEGSKITSAGIPGSSNVFGTIVFNGTKDITVNVSNSEVDAESGEGDPATPQAVVMYSYYPNRAGELAQNDIVNFGEGSTVKATGENAYLVQGNSASNKVNASSGTYQIDGGMFVPDSGTGNELVVTGGTWNKDVSPYVPAGTATREADGQYMVGDAAKAADGEKSGDTDGSSANDSNDASTHAADNENGSAVNHAATGNASNSGSGTSGDSGNASNASSQSTNVHPSSNTQAGTLLHTGDDSIWGIGLMAAFAVAAAFMVVLAWLRRTKSTKRE